MQRSNTQTSQQLRCKSCAIAPASKLTGDVQLCFQCALIKLSRDRFIEGATVDTSQHPDAWDGSGIAQEQISMPLNHDRTLQLPSMGHFELHEEQQDWAKYKAFSAQMAHTQQQQHIGAVAAVAFVNPAVESGFLYNPQFGVVPSGTGLPPPAPPSNAELEAHLRAAGVERRMVHPQAKGLLASLFDPFLSQVVPRPGMRMPLAFKPKILSPRQLERMLALPHAFPVFVRWPFFGSATATHYMLISRPNPPGTGLPFSALLGAPSFLHFAVQKYSPYGLTPNEPYALGIWLVPAANTIRLDLAIAQLLPAENIAVMDDKYGQEYSVSYLDMKASTKPEYDIARRALYVQYPAIAGPTFATRLLKEVPAYMAPTNVVIPEVLRTSPASLVEVQPGEQQEVRVVSGAGTEEEEDLVQKRIK
jgi:hypothetical protein